MHTGLTLYTPPSHTVNTNWTVGRTVGRPGNMGKLFMVP